MSGKTKELLICSGLAVIIGAQLGIIAGLFGQLLEFVESFRDEHYTVLVPFLGIAGAVILLLYKKVSPNSEQGLDLAIAYNMGEVDENGKIKDFGHARKLGQYPSAYVFLKLINNVIMLLFGASTGKEGTVATCGAAIGDYVSRIFKCRRYSRILLTAGVAAAVSGLFQTPLGGIFFAIEFTAAGLMFYNALVPSFIAAYASFFVSKLLGFQAFHQAIAVDFEWTPLTIALLILCSVIFGITGRLFAVALKAAKSFYRERVKNRILAIFIIGCAAAALLLLAYNGRYCGTGGKLIEQIFADAHFEYVDFALKFAFTVICITVGFTGGEMMPLMAIGATLGALMATVTHLPLGLIVVMGCAAVYCSATNTLFAPMFIGIEMFGASCSVYIAVACIIAFSLNGNHSVYSFQGHATPAMFSSTRKQDE